MKVWVVQGWDEGPRAAFDSEAKARSFAESEPDHEARGEDAGEHDCYPFIYELEVR